mmetsp:Transcript_15073/g.23397  ORF Transcript_15073/g.23397 Transcript_15073/m.23397 type:complete len:943 (-) Transcript_15073:71-2899(-)
MDDSPVPGTGGGPAPKRRRITKLARLENPAASDEDDDGLFDSDTEEQQQETEEINEDVYEYDDDAVEEEEEGENLYDTAQMDYQPIAALDQYDATMVDDRQYGQLSAEQRAKAEEEIDRHYARRNDVLFGMELDEDDDERDRRRAQFQKSGGDPDQQQQQDYQQQHRRQDYMNTDADVEDEVNLEAFDVPLQEWISQDRTRRAIQRRFRSFLMTYTDEDDDDTNTNTSTNTNTNNKVYVQRLKHMASHNLHSLDVSYRHIMNREPILAMWLADVPRDMLDMLNEVATRVTLFYYPSYSAITDEIFVRISEVPISDSLRELRRVHLGVLVKVGGVVTRRTGVYPQMKLSYYDCTKCRFVLGPFRNSNSIGGNPNHNASPGSCPRCESSGPFKLNANKTVYRNYQRVVLQETPGTVPPGRVPRTKEVVLTNDLIDQMKPGEEVEVTGIYLHNYVDNSNLFATHIEANHVLKREDVMAVHSLTESDKLAILKLSQDPNIGERIFHSIAPSIYGQEHVKRAIAMSLFGGVPKHFESKHRIRGDINVLLLGDPGTAKSQVLKYAETTAPRAVYSTGKGASAVGLTAAVRKDPMTKEWTLEGGALVLADQGLCLIDEFDKMNEQDRTSIHEAMEQQSISVSKAGIVTSLQARCSVIAAANPIGGRYDSSCTIAENVELTDPILQRFDVLCVLQDTVDPVADERLADFVTKSHMRSVPTCEMEQHGRGASLATSLQSQERNEREAEAGTGTETEEDKHCKLIPQHLLRKYIQYARATIRPKLSDFDQEKIASLYAALRKESASSGGVPIAVRHIESLLRMSEAHAKMHLREYVREDDIDAAIATMLESFVQSQKFSVQNALKKSFAKYLSKSSDRAHLLLHILQDQFRQEFIYKSMRKQNVKKIEIYLEEFESRAREKRIFNVSQFLRGKEFEGAGFVFDERRKIITRN